MELQDVDNRNFFIKENKAYTEDNVLVYNIFVYTIPKGLIADDIRDYFSRFGAVRDVKIIVYKKKRGCTAPKVGFVNFAEPESACSVLGKANHRVKGLRIGIKAGDSWNQPYADKACSVNPFTSWFPPSIASLPINGTNMLSLNDDCLGVIFGLLELKTKINFARVCSRFQIIFEVYGKREFKNLALCKFSGLTLWEIRDLLRFAGKDIESILGTIPYRHRERILEFVRTFCSKLKCINLDDSKMRIDCLRKLLHRYPHLQALTLRNCSLNDTSIQTVTHLKDLETLEIAENYELTGKFLSKLIQVKVLNLYACYNIQTSYMMDICEAMSNLRSLDIRRCERFSASFFRVMIKQCKNLEVLKMSCPQFPYENVTSLPQLKHLELINFSPHEMSERMLAGLVAHKADQLEILQIVAKNTLNIKHIDLISRLRQLKVLFAANNVAVDDDALIMFCQLQQLEELIIKGCSNITNRPLLGLVRSCQKLRVLNIQFCKQITIEFLIETIKFLQTTEERKKPLILVVYGTAMDYYSVSACKEYKEVKRQSLIKVIFQASTREFILEEGADIYNIWDQEHWGEDGYPTDDDISVHDPDEEEDEFLFVYDIFERF